LTDFCEIKRLIETSITAVYRERSVYPWSNTSQSSREIEDFFRQNIPDLPQRNQTDVEHGSATSIAFLLHSEHHIGMSTQDGLIARINRLGGECYMSLVEISNLGPFARIRFTKETFDKNTGALGYDESDLPFRVEDELFHQRLEKLLVDRGIFILSREILGQPVPDVELDVTPLGSATVYHCLFEEE
jgi:hypothetical protein